MVKDMSKHNKVSVFMLKTQNEKCIWNVFSQILCYIDEALSTAMPQYNQTKSGIMFMREKMLSSPC